MSLWLTNKPEAHKHPYRSESSGAQEKRHRDSKSSSAYFFLVARPAGFEPATYGFVVRHSIH